MTAHTFDQPVAASARQGGRGGRETTGTAGPGGHRRRRRGQGGGETGGLGDHKRSIMETALLIALVEQSGHGYALVDRVQQIVGDQLYVDPGGVYRILRLLEEAGMITSSWECGAAGPQRRTYAVEPAGRELLDSWAHVLAEHGKAMIDLARLARERLA